MSLHHRFLLYASRGIAFLWAGFWLFFGIAASIGEGLRLTGVIMHVIFPGIIFLALAFFAWRWPIHGAVVLALCGVAVLVVYPLFMGSKFPLPTVLMILLTMAVPPLVAGALLFLHARKHQQAFPFEAED